MDYGGWVTNILAGLFFLIGIAINIGKLSGKPMLSASWCVCAISFVFAFLLSPYGLMRLVEVITDGLESLNETLKGYCETLLANVTKRLANTAKLEENVPIKTTFR